MSELRESSLARVRRLGVQSAPAIDLLAVALGGVTQDDELEARARELLKARKLDDLRYLSVADLAELGELPLEEAWRVLAALELGRRVAHAGKGQPDRIERPDDVFALFGHIRHRKQETFSVALLNAKNEVLSVRDVHLGTATMSVVGAREVFREAVREGATAIIVAHNHPSGDPEPSPEDIAVTRKLVQVGDLLDTPVLDHVIVGHGSYISLRQRGLM